MRIWKKKTSPSLIQRCARSVVHTIRAIERKSLSLGSFFATFTALVIVRMAEQQWLDGFPRYGVEGQFFEFTQTFLFFLFSLGLFVIIAYYGTHIHPRRTANIFLIGFTIILLPPIIDTLRFETFWSYYEFAGVRDLFYAFWTVFAASPSIGITDGVRVEIVLSVLAMGAYAYMHTQRIMRSIGAAAATYVALFFLASLPSWITICVYGWQQGFLSVSAVQVAQMFLTPNPILTHAVDNVALILHVHMSIVYVIGISVLGTFLGRRFFVAQWRTVWCSVWRWETLAALGFVGTGLVTALALGLQSSQILTLSTFAVPALAVLLLSAALLVAGMGILRNGIARQRSIGALLVGAALLFVTIINPFASIFFVIIFALFVLGQIEPFTLVKFYSVRLVLYVLQSIMLYLAGASVFLESLNRTVTSGRVVVFIALIAGGVFLLSERLSHKGVAYERTRTITALYWFFVILASIPLFNIFWYKWSVLTCALTAFFLIRTRK